MDSHSLLGHLAACSSCVGDGGPWRFRRNGSPLPEKYLPGRYLAGLRPEARAEIVDAVNDRSTVPAPWFLRLVIDQEGDVQRTLPPPPIQRGWSCRGRWARS